VPTNELFDSVDNGAHELALCIAALFGTNKFQGFPLDVFAPSS